MNIKRFTIGVLFIFCSILSFSSCSQKSEYDADTVFLSSQPEVSGKHDEYTEIRFTAADGDEYIYQRKLPVIYITADSEITSKDEYVSGRMRIELNNENSEYKNIYTSAEGIVQLKLRGNSSLMFEKKSYKLKLDEKSNLFGMGSNKHWTLLACMFDRSLLRDKAGLDLSGELMDYYTESVFADIVMNGKYIGTYQLCEQIRISEERVDITNIEDMLEKDNIEIQQFTTDNGYDITGGYLLEISVQYDEKSKFRTKLGNPVMFKNPKDASENKEMFNYVKDSLNEFESIIKSKDMFSDDGNHYSELFDMDDLVNYWLISQIVKTHDFMINSTFLYKDSIDENGKQDKFHMGPLWDLGNSLGNYTSANGWTEPIRYGDWSFKSDENNNWYKYICRDPYFMVKAEEAFCRIVDSVYDITRDKGTIDIYNDYLKEAVDANQALYPTFGNPVHGKEGIENLPDEIAWIKKFLNERVKFLTKQLSDLKNISLPFCVKTEPEIKIILTNGVDVLPKGKTSDKIGVYPDAYSDSAENITAEIACGGLKNQAESVAVYLNDKKLGVYPAMNGKVSVKIPENFILRESDGKNVVIARTVTGSGEVVGMNYITLTVCD